jgi:hypothetical protein
MKILALGNTSVLKKLSCTLQKHGYKHGIEFYKTCTHIYDNCDNNTNILEDINIFSLNDLWYLNNYDVYLIDGSWGSTHPKRNFTPNEEVLYKKKPPIINVFNEFVVNISKSLNKKLLVLESATLSRIRPFSPNNHKHFSPGYNRIGLNHWTYGKTKFCKPKGRDRLEKFVEKHKKRYGVSISNIFDHQWKNNKNGYILILPGLEHDPTMSYKSVEEFVSQTVKKLRKYTQRKITVKPHPNSEITYDFIKDKNFEVLNRFIKFSEIANNCYCAVIDNSTSIFELVNLGIPCITSNQSFGVPLNNLELSKVENLNYADNKTVLKWYEEMSYTEFTKDEYLEESIISVIKEILK